MPESLVKEIIYPLSLIGMYGMYRIMCFSWTVALSGNSHYERIE